MDSTLHLHENERLLLSVRPSAAFFLYGAVRSVLESLVVSLLLGLLLAFAAHFSFVLPFVFLLILLLLILGGTRFLHWRHASFRVTTERMLIEYSGSLFSHTLATIKWGQYQESSLGHRGMLDLLFRSRPLVIRYGAADSKLFVHFPSLTMASDIKHYLDKVDSAVRNHQMENLKAFVAKKKGERDAGK